MKKLFSFAMSLRAVAGNISPPIASLVLLLVVLEPCGAAPVGFVNTGNLVSARAFHTATLLPDGRVLAAGGLGDSGALASAELYDSASGTWSVTGVLATAGF
jgi:hypothetical protein